MGLSHSSKVGSSSNLRPARLALAIGLCVVAGGVLFWRMFSSSEPPVDPAIAQKQKEIQSNIQSSAPPAPPTEVIHRSRKGGPVNPK